MPHKPRHHPELFIVLAVAALWRIAFMAGVRDTPLQFWYVWDQTDMHAYWQQAQAIAAGDWLARVPLLPHHSWMSVAPPEAWHAWFNPHVFYQAPLYSYLLALLTALGLETPVWATRIQAFFGVISAGLMYSIARRMFGRRAALAAGLLLALYGPLIMVEGQMLRESAIMLLTLAALWVAGIGGAPSWPRAVACGVLIGALAMMQEVSADALLGAMIVTLGLRASAARSAKLDDGARPGHAALQDPRQGWIQRRGLAAAPSRRIAALLLAGAAAGFSPLLARNLAVGAPPLSQSSAGGMTWVMANRPGAPFGGVIWNPPGEDFVQIMTRAAGRPARMFSETLRSYGGAWSAWLGHWLERAAALLIGPETPDNTSYDFFRLHVPILTTALDFRALLPLGVAGIALWGFAGRRRWRRALGRGRMQGALLIYGVLTWIAVSGVYPLGRYRIFFLPLLAPFAGWMLARLWLKMRATRWRAVGAGLGLILALGAGQWSLGRCWPAAGLRAQDFVIAAQRFLEWQRPDLAAGELDLGLAQGVGDKTMLAERAFIAGLLAQGRNREAEAAADYEEAIKSMPDLALALGALGWLRATAGDPAVRNAAEALTLARRASMLLGGDAESLDLLAAAQAAGGDPAGAAKLAEQALAQARAEKKEALAQGIERRLAAYRAGHNAVGLH